MGARWFHFFEWREGLGVFGALLQDEGLEFRTEGNGVVVELLFLEEFVVLELGDRPPLFGVLHEAL